MNYTKDDIEKLARGERLPRKVFDAIVKDPEAVKEVYRLMRVAELFSPQEQEPSEWTQT